MLERSTPVPVIYAPRGIPQRLEAAPRALAILVALACLGVLAVAVYVVPSAAGIGSHTGLGMAPCSFEERTGLPCPTCGMTTSFAHFVRGQWIASAYVQPMGAALALGCAAGAWAALYIGLTGRPAHRLLRFVPARYYLYPILTLMVLAWVWKMIIHLQGMDGWSNL